MLKAVHELVSAVGKHGGSDGANRVDWAMTEEHAFRRVTSKDPFLEAIAVHFGAERSAAEQVVLFEELGRSPFSPQAHQVMHEFLTSGLTPEDNARCTTVDPPPSYFMMCDDEEFEVSDCGQMDGDLKIRRRFAAWRLIVLATPACTFVEFSGESDFGNDGVGGLFISPPAAGQSATAERYTPIYRLDEGEVCLADRPAVGETVDGAASEAVDPEDQKMAGRLLSGLADAFERGLDASALGGARGGGASRGRE